MTPTVAGPPSALQRVSTALYLRPRALLAVLLGPPLLWLGAVYLGAATRYAVNLDGGGQLLVLEQNVDAAKPTGLPGQRVRLTWHRRHEQPLREDGEARPA